MVSGFINRLLLFVFALCMAALSAAVLGASLGLLPESLWLNEVHYALGQKESVLAAGIALLVSLHLLGIACEGRSEEDRLREDGEVMMLATPNGEVQVALKAIRSLLSDTIRQVHGVRDCEIHLLVRRVKGKGKGQAPASLLGVRVNVVLGTEAPVRTASDAVREAAERVLDATFGIADAEVRVRVADVTNTPVRGRRVV